MMKRLFERIFGKQATPVVSGNEPASSTTPTLGSIFSFRTSPFDVFGPQETGRYATFKVIASDAKMVVVAVLDGVWTTPPVLGQAERLGVLREHRFASTGEPAVFGVQTAWWEPTRLLDIRRLGDAPVSREEAELADVITGHRVGARYASLPAVSFAAEGEWRWSNDRTALVDEHEKRNAGNAARRAAEQERYHNRLSKLTWDQLRSEIPFERWSPSPPYPPETFTTAARQTIRDTCAALEALGPKPRKSAVRAVLKKCVEWFNIADEQAGGVIETEEREDICAILEEMAFVARQKSLVEEVDGWREW